MEMVAAVPEDGGMTDDFPILAAVAASPTHPYELLEHLQALGLRATRSTLYRRVDGLIERGYLEAEDGRGESGHFRRLLRLTARGREAAGREAAEVLRREPLESPLFALALAAAGVSQREDALGVLRPRLAAAARRLTEEERALREAEADPWSEAARERRIAHLQADISWLQGLLARRFGGAEKTASPGERVNGPEAIDGREPLVERPKFIDPMVQAEGRKLDIEDSGAGGPHPLGQGEPGIVESGWRHQRGHEAQSALQQEVRDFRGDRVTARLGDRSPKLAQTNEGDVDRTARLGGILEFLSKPRAQVARRAE